MSFVFNPFTGSLDIVKIPLADGTVAPTMGGNGDLQTAVVGTDGRLYFQANGTRYYISGTAPVINAINVPSGQPIPIGMGLTFTYA
jgi:hypothetical protein